MSEKRAAEYRDQAGKLRAEAETASDEYGRTLLIQMAEAYEKLAVWAARQGN